MAEVLLTHQSSPYLLQDSPGWHTLLPTLNFNLVVGLLFCIQFWPCLSLGSGYPSLLVAPLPSPTSSHHKAQSGHVHCDSPRCPCLWDAPPFIYNKPSPPPCLGALMTLPFFFLLSFIFFTRLVQKPKTSQIFSFSFLFSFTQKSIYFK